MVTRRKAITQSLAYLVMENGVYGVGVSMSLDFPFIVELGILLDVFVGVFLMGNLLFHLDREFEHLDADKLTELSDLSESAADRRRRRTHDAPAADDPASRGRRDGVVFHPPAPLATVALGRDGRAHTWRCRSRPP